MNCLFVLGRGEGCRFDLNKTGSDGTSPVVDPIDPVEVSYLLYVM